MSTIDQIPTTVTDEAGYCDDVAGATSVDDPVVQAGAARAIPRVRQLALMLLLAAQFVIIIDASIINVALPSIGTALHFSRTDLSWVVNAYTLTFGGFLLLGGRLADLLGRRRMFMSGLILFTLASLAAGLAASEGWLIAARSVQGLGAAFVSPAALSILITTFTDDQERNQALGAWGAIGGAAAIVGTLLGGILTSGLGWEWVLFVNVPIGLCCTALAPRLLDDGRDTTAGRTFDALGAVTVTAGVALAVYAVDDAVNAGWGSAATLAKVAGAVGLLAGFVCVELRASDPLVPFAIFRLRTLRGANVVAVLIGASMFSMFFFLTLYLQDVLGKSAIQTGLCFLPIAVVIVLASGTAVQLVGRVGFKTPLIAGLLLASGGLLWLSRAPVQGSFIGDVLGPEILVGLGLGFAFVPVTIAALAGTRPQEAGLASGLINATQWIGGALGLAVLSTIANGHTQQPLHTDEERAVTALTQGYDRAFLVGAGVALAGALLAVVLLSSRDSREHARSASPPQPVTAPA